MFNDLDIDMEDLEARLYGQVHHGDRAEEAAGLEANSGYYNTPYSNPQNRYFTNIPAAPHVFQSYNPYTPPSLIDNNFYGQLGLMFNPAAFNNIVVVQQPPTQIFNNNNNDFETGIAARRAKNQRRRNRKRYFGTRNLSYFKQHHLDKRHSSDTYNRDQNSNFNLNARGSSGSTEARVEIVVVSSEDEQCNANDNEEDQISNKTETPKISDPIKNEDVVVQDESKIVDETDTTQIQNQTEDVDDVIFVETTPNEIINIDCDDETNVNDCATSVVCTEQNEFCDDAVEENVILFVDDLDLTNPSDMQETNLNADDFLDDAVEENAILYVDDLDHTNPSDTQEANLNADDFLDDAVEENAILYVDDLDLTNPSDMQETNLNVDVSDSETSVTSDSQNHIFKEPTFETTSKDISSLNLNDFENYITTPDIRFEDPSSTPCSSNTNNSSAKANEHCVGRNNRNSSDSSSESDYDFDLSVSVPDQTPNKVLPTLSPMVSDTEFMISKFDDTIMEINNGKCKVVQSLKKTSETITSVICISSSDELSDLDIEAEKSIELLNIEGPNVFPKQDDPACSTNNIKPYWITTYWSDDMKKFYNESWNQENFSCEEEQKKMSDDPKMWKIIDKDRSNIFATPKGTRCHRCRQFGHKAIRCPNKSNIPKCILCATNGHYEARCPNRLCSGCGVKIPYWTIYCNRCANFRYTVCRICLMRGHKAAHCSDLWRRYHLTVSEGPVVCPKTRLFKLPQDRWCCGCASQGHYEHECNYVIRTYLKTIPFVHSYEDVYADSNCSQNQNVLNKPAQREIPSSLDLEIDRNETSTQNNSKATLLILKDSEALRLLSHSGVTFLKRISIDTDLQIKVLTHGHGNLKTYVCVIDGSEGYKGRATESIKQFCSTAVCLSNLSGLLSKKKFTKNRLVNNFSTLQTVLPWTQLVKNTYNKILMLEKQIGNGSSSRLQLQEKKNKCGVYYMALNAVLICKFKAGDQKYLKLLKEWRQRQGNFADLAVQEAYKYVFLNNTSTDIDYKNLIPNLSPKRDKSFQLYKAEIDEIMESSTRLCKSFNFDKDFALLENYYRLVTESNYGSRRHLKNFRKFCKRFNKYRNVK